jgi:hypothetical protein
VLASFGGRFSHQDCRSDGFIKAIQQLFEKPSPEHMSGLDKFNIPRLIQDTLRKGTELVSAVVGKWNVVLGAIRETR